MTTLPMIVGEALPAFSADPAVASDSANRYARAEKSAGTLKAYESDLRDFARWCNEVGAGFLPAEPVTVANYLASLADRGCKASTIMRRQAAIAFAHKRRGLEPPTNVEEVKRTARGIRRTIGTAVKAKAPATAKAMAAMLKLIPDTLSGKRDRALLLIGFAAALRRSELVALDVADLERAPEGVIVHIRVSKTDQEAKGHEVAVPRGTRLRPVEALEDWLEAAGIREGAVFRAVDKADHVQPGRLTGRSVADIVKRWAAAGKLDPKMFSGHSLRAGFVTSALETGADLLRVMAQTRHRSVETVKKYDRRSKIWQAHAGGKFL